VLTHIINPAFMGGPRWRQWDKPLWK
jgi:hypothetical protein